MNIQVRSLALPAGADETGPVGEEFRAVADFVARVRTAHFGTDAVAATASDLLGILRDRVDGRVATLVAWADGVVVGRAYLVYPTLEAETLAEGGWQIDPGVPDADQRRVASELLAELDAQTRDEGRPWVLLEVVTEDGTHAAASGVGSIDPDAPDAAVLLAAGFTLQQVYRYQLADLAASQLPEVADPGDGYTIASFVGRVPDDQREAFCAMASLMGTEIPVADIEPVDAVWDEARLVGYEQLMADTGRTLITSIAYAPGGEPAGYTELMVPTEGPLARQGDTLVAPGHRGHGLGMRLKAANLALLRTEFPDRRWAVTDNAAENTHMLAINERLGFLTVHREGLFQRLPSEA